jgi:hypothetical protein
VDFEARFLYSLYKATEGFIPHKSFLEILELNLEIGPSRRANFDPRKSVPDQNPAISIQNGRARRFGLLYFPLPFVA